MPGLQEGQSRKLYGVLLIAFLDADPEGRRL